MIGFFAQRLGLSPIVGYFVAGTLVEHQHDRVRGCGRRDGARLGGPWRYATLVTPHAADDDGGFFRWKAWQYYQAGAMSLTPDVVVAPRPPSNLRLVR